MSEIIWTDLTTIIVSEAEVDGYGLRCDFVDDNDGSGYEWDVTLTETGRTLKWGRCRTLELAQAAAVEAMNQEIASPSPEPDTSFTHRTIDPNAGYIAYDKPIEPSKWAYIKDGKVVKPKGDSE